ncbi:MAG: TonB-dependent siderophore receptor [Azospirillum sp.]|nr:TonB-dependent siderophore receptor [Azospirillum sp.]
MMINERTRKPHRLPRADKAPSLTVAAGLLAAAILGPLPVSAEDGGASDSETGAGVTLPPITVEASDESATGPISGYVARRDLTATKTDTPLIETPQSISVITRDQMDDQGVQTVGEALNYTASVYSGGRPGNRYDSIFIRGFGGFGGGANYVEYLDGMRLQRGLSYAIPSFDQTVLERVEVLRGPASVLYGQANPGGIINMTSKRPTADRFGEVVAGYGSDGYGYSTFDLSGPIDAEQTMLYRVTGVGRYGNGPIDNAEEARGGVAPSFTWKPNADTSLTILSSYQRDPESYYAPFLPVQGTVLPNRTGKIKPDFDPGEHSFDTFQRTQGTVGYLFETALSDALKLRQNLRYLHVDSTFKAVSLASLSADQSTLNRRSTLSREQFDGVTVDNQGEVKFATGPVRHTLLFGVDYQYGNADRELGNGTAPTLNLTAPVYNRIIANPAITSITNQRQQQLGLYGQDQVRFDHWAFLMGLRHDWADTETNVRLGGTDSRQADTALTWRTGLVYLFDFGLAPYASYATSFQPQSGTDAAGSSFKPTEGKQYEAGVKFQPPGTNSSVTVAAFHLTQANVLTTDTQNVGFRVATGEVTAKGVEIEGRASLTRNIDLIGAYSYTDITNTRDNTAAIVGKRPAGAPNHLASLWGNYRVNEGAAAGLGLGAGVRYIGPSAGDNTNSVTVPGYTLVDAAISYDLDHVAPALDGVRVQVNATNLFDKDYVAACSSATTCFYGGGRTVLTSLRYRW